MTTLDWLEVSRGRMSRGVLSKGGVGRGGRDLVVSLLLDPAPGVGSDQVLPDLVKDED